jgi:hypothetical protein
MPSDRLRAHRSLAGRNDWSAEWSATGCATAVPLCFSLTFERGRGMVTVPLPGGNTLVPALHLKKMQPMKGYPRRIERAL